MPQLLKSKAAFRHTLHAWFAVHARRLPWREEPSLYQTVVSEFMLQQTQVAIVVPYFKRWLRAWPDFASLAAAHESEVLKLWEGLGYYDRARRLHRLARSVVARPAPPRTAAEWRELPGVGPYTAAAIASIAFAEPVACVDGNVVRILARLTGEGRGFRDGSAAARYFAPLAATLVGDGNPGRHNQAMMELGATVCLRKNPRCPTCPVGAFCVARRTGGPERLPRLRPKKVERREVARAWCQQAGRLLLRRGSATARRLAGLHELPEVHDLRVAPAETTVLVRRRRTITRFQITETIYAVGPTAAVLARVARDPALEWVPLAGLARVTLSGPQKRWIQELLAAAGPGGRQHLSPDGAGQAAARRASREK